jgi:hypothetical protein
MKTIKTFGAALLALLACGVLSASAAEAYEWQIGGSPLTKAEAVESTSTVTFENTKEGYEFSCAIARKGTVSTGGKGEITSIASSGGAKAISCTLKHSDADCESAMEIEAVGLPWATELVAVGGELRDKLTATHEWKVKCKEVGGLTRTNSCNATGSVGPHNVNGGVEQIADSDSPRTGCSLDGGEAFVTKGAELLTASAGTLSISPAPLEWHLGGAGLGEPLTASWSGKIKVSDPAGPETVECEATAGGRVGLAGAGEVTEWTTSGCTGHMAEGSACETPKVPTIEALNLPWYTELVTIEGVTRDAIVSGGKGTPGYRMTCRLLGIKLEDQCTGAINLATTNVATGVSAVFDTAEKLNCTRGGSGQGTVEGTQTIKAGGGKLEVT